MQLFCRGPIYRAQEESGNWVEPRKELQPFRPSRGRKGFFVVS